MKPYCEVLQFLTACIYFIFQVMIFLMLCWRHIFILGTVLRERVRCSFLSALCQTRSGNDGSTESALLQGANSHIHFHNHLCFWRFPLLGSPVSCDESSASARTAANYQDEERERKEESRINQRIIYLGAPFPNLRRSQIGIGVPVMSHQEPSDLSHTIRHGVGHKEALSASYLWI